MAITSRKVVPSHVTLAPSTGEVVNGVRFMKNNTPFYVLNFKNKFTPLSRSLTYVVKAETIKGGVQIEYPEDRAEAIKLAKQHGFMMPNEIIAALKACSDANEAALVQFTEDNCNYEIAQADGTTRPATSFSQVYAAGTSKTVFTKEMESRGIEIAVEAEVVVEEEVPFGG